MSAQGSAHGQAQIDVGLITVIQAWLHLPEAIKRGILAMVARQPSRRTIFFAWGVIPALTCRFATMTRRNHIVCDRDSASMSQARGILQGPNGVRRQLC